jgi:DedD protein
METRVKERLVGAVILVALIVALVPEILSGPHGPNGANTPASAEQPMRTYTVELEDRALPAAETPAASVPEVIPLAPPPEQAHASAPEETPATAPAASVTEPEPVAEAPPEPAAAAPSTSGWSVQLGSFSNEQNAERLARDLRKRGYKAYVSPHESNGQKRMRVRVGPEQNRARAEQLAKRLKRDGLAGTVVEQP